MGWLETIMIGMLESTGLQIGPEVRVGVMITSLPTVTVTAAMFSGCSPTVTVTAMQRSLITAF
jgi:hypothetical protein